MKMSPSKIYCIFIPLLLASMNVARSEDEHDSERSSAKHRIPVNNTLYKEECGSCHMAYPADLLRAGTWRKIMATLNNHFGDNAEITPVKQQEITQYLQTNSLDKGKSQRESDSQVLRISQQAVFQHHHREIPARLIAANAAVKSLSNCPACHQRAEQGSFNEGEINIPGYGRWED